MTTFWLNFAAIPIAFVMLVLPFLAAVSLWRRKDRKTVLFVTSVGVAFWLLPIFLPTHRLSQRPGPPSSTMQRRTCQSWLGHIANAKADWADATKQKESALPQLSDIAPYLEGKVMPVCPTGGTYTLGAVNEPPRCSHADKGHALPSTSGVAGAPAK